jgi:hypothetical protein
MKYYRLIHVELTSQFKAKEMQDFDNNDRTRPILGRV